MISIRQQNFFLFLYLLFLKDIAFGNKLLSLWHSYYKMLMNRLMLIVMTAILDIAVIEASELRNLRVNRMQVPRDIVRMGQFSWQIETEDHDVYQLAYHIRVASSEEGLQGGPTLMWDSERRESPDMVQVPYQGRRFPYESTVYWQLEVWLSNNEHLQSPVQQIQTGRKGTMWNCDPVTKDDVLHDYFYYLRWLHTLMIHQAENGELYPPVLDDTLAIPVNQAAAVLYSLYKEEGDIKVLYDYYNMVRNWMMFCYRKNSTLSSQLISMMTEIAQKQNLHADVLEFSRLKGDSTVYQPFWLYTDEPAWCGGAIRQSASSIAYSRVDITIPSLSDKDKDSVSHHCPYGNISSTWRKEDGGIITWEIQIPVGVRARVLYPKDYADNEGLRSNILGSGNWMLRLLPLCYK